MALSKPLAYKINENTRKCTGFYDAARPYKVLSTLQKEGELELEEVDFYGGYRIRSDQFTPSFFEARRELANQRAYDVRFRTELDALLKSFKTGHICFVGPAGIGKTTLMKSIARDILDKKYEGLEEIQVVHFVQCRHHSPSHLLTAGEFLFGSDLTNDEIKIVIEFAILNPNKILFVLDSLDTMQFSADGVNKSISVEEKVGPGAILCNFLSGKVLAGCRIITSGREHSIRNYMGEVRPQKVIALLGFNEDTIKQVIVGYVGQEKANEIIQDLEEKMPEMLVLCNTPVILVYTLIGLQTDSDLKPTTMTRIMVIVLQSIIRSEHMRQKYDAGVPDTMHRLEELAHLGNIEKRVLFFHVDFQKVGLEPEKATDLAVLVPGGLPQKLMQGESVMFYTHQIIQEVLGSLWIAGRDVDVLKEFVETCLNTRHFGVIRRFLYGILLDREVYESVSEDLLSTGFDDEHYDERVELLKKNLESRLQSDLGPSDLLELMVSMNEAKDEISDIAKSSLLGIDLHGIPLSASDVYTVGSVISRCRQLHHLDLHYPGLDSTALNILAKTLKGTTMKLVRLFLSGNTNLAIDGILAVGKIISECNAEQLYLRLCKFTVEQLRTLAQVTREHRILLLDITDDRNATHEDICAVANLLPNVKQSVGLLHWKISDEDEYYLQEKLFELDQEQEVWLDAEHVLKGKARTTISEKRDIAPYSDEKNSGGPDSLCGDAQVAGQLLITDAEITQRIKDGISRPISTAKIIGKVGGSVHLRGCELKFPPNVICEETSVGVTVRSTTDDVPPGHMSISPLLKCSTSNVKFIGLVEVKLPIHYRAQKDQIVVFCKKKCQSGWQEVDATTVLDGDAVTFKVSHFCWYMAFVRFIWPSRKILIHNFLFQRKGSIFVLTCIQDEKVKQESIRDIRMGGYELVLPLPDKIELEEDERMSYRLECCDPHDVIDPTEEVHIAGAIIAQRKVETNAFNVDAAPESNKVRIRYTLRRPNEEPKISAFRVQCDKPDRIAHISSADATAFMGVVETRGCTENKYLTHLTTNTIYRIDPNRKKGRALIINNGFRGTRNGSERDYRNMVNLWKSLGFDVVAKENLTAKEMLDACQRFAQNIGAVSVVVVVLMSHGGNTEDRKEFFLGEDRQRLFVDDVIAIFTFRRSPQLRGIPKVLMFQACRGDGEDFDWHCEPRDQDDAETEGPTANRADILITFPTQGGYKAIRNRVEGSWLINAITHVFTEHAHHKHVLDMLTIVNKEVANKKTWDGRVQASNQLSYLTKDLFLFPGWPKGTQEEERTWIEESGTAGTVSTFH